MPSYVIHLSCAKRALEMLPEIPDAADHGRGEPARN